MNPSLDHRFSSQKNIMKNIFHRLFTLIFLFSGTYTAFAQNQVYNYQIAKAKVFKELKPSFEEVPIYRLQLKFKTGSIENADTDSPVFVMLNDNDFPFYLNLSKNDREKGKTDVYDILSTSISKIKDLEYLEIGISGRDGWNIKEVEILVNGVGIYKKYFSNSAGWIDRGSSKHKESIMIPHNKLRNSPIWGYNGITENIYKAPSTISAEMIKSQMECLVGNSLKFMPGYKWGKKYGNEYVSVKKIDHNTVHVDIDLKQCGMTSLTDSETDVDFDIHFKCENGKLKASVTNLSIEHFDFGSISPTLGSREALTGNLSTHYTHDIIGLNNIEEIYDFDFNYYNNSPSQNICAEGLMVQENGDVFLGRARQRVVRDQRTNRKGRSSTVVVSRKMIRKQ
jgi:hypothetical protein